jgi:ribonuclease HII
VKDDPTHSHEIELRRLGFELIAGIDEVGRGALAGPVVAAAALLPTECRIDGVRDSKLVPEQERERLYEVIIGQAICWSVGIIEQAEIDSINILQATFAAMRQAVTGMTVQPDYLLIDGRDTPALGRPCRAIIGGDALSVSIAAASIIAKVTRDRIMRQLHDLVPQYGFDRHKGYGTDAHRRAILEHGPSSYHRATFLRKLMQEGIVA